ncbi:hypothetical protein QYF36_013701 [Acer negundo]|nr:hypothetical protein QYF36_013701 [Acer negundo]
MVRFRLNKTRPKIGHTRNAKLGIDERRSPVRDGDSLEESSSSADDVGPYGGPLPSFNYSIGECSKKLGEGATVSGNQQKVTGETFRFILHCSIARFRFRSPEAN